MSRTAGSGCLNTWELAELFRLVKMRKELSNRALAARFNTTEGCIKAAVYRVLHREAVCSDPTQVPRGTEGVSQ